MIKGLVSCIVPTYKRPDLIIGAIESILEQTYVNLEVLVIDDNEPYDQYSIETKKKINLMTDRRVRYIQQEHHVNGAKARNIGIENAHGEYVAFLDDDDRWCRDKLEKQVDFLENNKDYAGVSCLYIYYRNGQLIRKNPVYTDENLHRKVLERSVSVGTCTLLLKKEVLDQTDYFNVNLNRHQELQLILDFLIKGKIGIIQEYLVKGNMDFGENRANATNVVEYKQAFFDAVKKHFDIYDNKIQKNIYAAHYFEIILVALRNKNLKLVIKYLWKIGFNIQAYKNLCKRYKMRRENSSD
ncbi:glycosyltransferase family 2 protein [[Clostridium] symbiosum]|uniref:glycosyltransferase family 2 protein n=1 Tax=Clostridium symbiosum TaxID=1512 RepID=UPI00321A5CC7